MPLSRIIKFSLFSALFALPLAAHGSELKFQDKVWTVEPRVSTVSGYVVRNNFELSAFVKQGFGKTDYSLRTVGLDSETLKVLDEVQASINQETKGAKLVVEGEWAKEFEPGQNGQALDLYETIKEISSHKAIVELPVRITKPAVTLDQTNNLGINELIATGESDFSGSTKNRIHNVTVGASRYQSLIIPQGEEFSFNKFLGEVDGEHGFLPELVIKKTGVAPEFGGGLCQVSSTAFRAAMNAGLPITARRNHSFAVHYYAPQGTDATIYPGVQDFKFVNDLPSPLLIRTRLDVPNRKLYFDFYGTKDNRKISFDGPYQYDKKANGALKAVWTRWVEKDGEKKEQVFNSNYQPPALFQQTTQASTPNPQAEPNPNSPAPTPTPEPAPVTDPTPPPAQTN